MRRRLFLFGCPSYAFWRAVCIRSHRVVDSVLRGFGIGVLYVDSNRFFVSLDFNHLADLDVVETAEQCAFARHLSFAEVETCDAADKAVGAVVEVYAFLGRPGVFETLIDGVALVDVHS